MALVLYNEIEYAQAAVKETKGRKIGGNKIKVCRVTLSSISPRSHPLTNALCSCPAGPGLYRNALYGLFLKGLLLFVYLAPWGHRAVSHRIFPENHVSQANVLLYTPGSWCRLAHIHLWVSAHPGARSVAHSSFSNDPFFLSFSPKEWVTTEQSIFCLLFCLKTSVHDNLKGLMHLIPIMVKLERVFWNEILVEDGYRRLKWLRPSCEGSLNVLPYFTLCSNRGSSKFATQIPGFSQSHYLAT